MVDMVDYMLHRLYVNLLRWRNLIGSLSRDIGKYPMIEISNSRYCFHRKMSRFASVSKQITNKQQQQINPVKKCYLIYFWSVRM